MNQKIYFLVGLVVIVLIVGGVFSFLNKSKSLEKVENTVPQIATNEATEQIVTSSEETSTGTESISEEKYYTMEEVQKHNSRESCWTVIRGDVYDLTAWIDKHPGGADKILNICGKDGAQAFEKKHGGKEKPEKTLEQFEIGNLKQ